MSGACAFATAVGLVATLAGRPALGSGDASLCPLVESGYITTDGLLDDWKGVRPTRIGDGDDASFELRCAYDDKLLYLSVNVRDERVIRTRKGVLKAEDHVTFRFGFESVPLVFHMMPGSSTGGPKLVARKRPRGLKVEDSLQDDGFSIEVEFPRAKLRGIGPRTPAIRADIEFHDTDKATAYKIQRVERFRGYLHTQAGLQAYRAFAAKIGLRRSDVVYDRLADVDTAPGAERVIVAGKTIGVLSDSFAFMQLPIQAASDLKSVKLVDFDGDGRRFLVAQYRQVGGGGAREVVAILEFKPDGAWNQVLGFEVAKELGSRSVRSSWRLVPRGAIRKREPREPRRGLDLLIEAGTAKGFNAGNWNEQPATDVQPILLPWSGDKRVVYWFDGNGAQTGTIDPRRYRRWRKREAKRNR